MAVDIPAADITTVVWVAILSYGPHLEAVLAGVSVAVPRVVLAVAAQAIGAVLAAVADSTAVALAEAGKSSQITKSPFFPMDCFVPLQIP